jgi:hypothetical protein
MQGIDLHRHSNFSGLLRIGAPAQPLLRCVTKRMASIRERDALPLYKSMSCATSLGHSRQ